VIHRHFNTPFIALPSSATPSSITHFVCFDSSLDPLIQAYLVSCLPAKSATFGKKACVVLLGVVINYEDRSFAFVVSVVVVGVGFFTFIFAFFFFSLEKRVAASSLPVSAISGPGVVFYFTTA